MYEKHNKNCLYIYFLNFKILAIKFLSLNNIILFQTKNHNCLITFLVNENLLKLFKL